MKLWNIDEVGGAEDMVMQGDTVMIELCMMGSTGSRHSRVAGFLLLEIMTKQHNAEIMYFSNIFFSYS